MEQARLLDDEGNLAVAHLSLAGVCLELKDVHQALHHAQETLRIARELSFLPLDSTFSDHAGERQPETGTAR